MRKVKIILQMTLRSFKNIHITAFEEGKRFITVIMSLCNDVTSLVSCAIQGGTVRCSLQKLSEKQTAGPRRKGEFG